MIYRRCSRKTDMGLKLPVISLGLWHNFGSVDPLNESRKKIFYAFDRGITHFDLANNYGPLYGTAEETFGRIMEDSLRPYRDELIISTKAGHDMWPGPYGEGGSRKYLMASIEQSLKRLKLDYVDIFYSHCFDPYTPLEETIETLLDIVRQGKALYAAISKYPFDKAEIVYKYMKDQHHPCLLYQGKYNIFDREMENDGIIGQAYENEVGFVAFSPLAQGLLSDRYLKGIPADSRIGRGGYLKESSLTDSTLKKIKQLNNIAAKREQSLAQMALAWLINDNRISSVVIGASSVDQIKNNLDSLNNYNFSNEESKEIDKIIKS